MTNRVNFSITPFPDIQWSGDIAQLAQLLAEHLNGDLDQSVFTGQAGGTEPLTDVGPWLKSDSQWWFWDGVIAKYRPFSLVLGRVQGDDIVLTTVYAGAIGENIALFLPSKAGTIATIDDARAPLPTLPRANSSALIRWVGNTYVLLTSNVTVTDAGNGKDGQSVDLYLETPPGTAIAHTVAFPAAWRKTTGLTLSTTDGTHRAVDRFKISRVGNDTFVSKTGAFQINQAGPDGDTTPPIFNNASIFENTSKVYLYFDEPVVASNTPSAWVVKKNGTNVSVTTVTVETAYEVQLTLISSVPSGVELTAQYLGGGGLSDLAGNDSAAFGPVNVDIV